MQVFVRDNDVNSALRVLKKKMQREGTIREMKRRRAYEKPSERRVREKGEAIRRHRKMLRKRLEREGYGSGRTITSRGGVSLSPHLPLLVGVPGSPRYSRSVAWPSDRITVSSERSAID